MISQMGGCQPQKRGVNPKNGGVNLYFGQIFQLSYWRMQGGRLPWSKMFSISCSFSENFAKLYAGAPGRWAVPPRTGNPGLSYLKV